MNGIDEFLDSASSGDLDTIKQMMYDGDVSVLCTRDYNEPYNHNGSRGKNAVYFALVNGHIDIAEYLIKISSGVVINDSINNDDLVKELSLKGDLKTLDWIIENLHKHMSEFAVAYIAIRYLFHEHEHELIERISIHYNIDANKLTDTIVLERKRFIEIGIHTFNSEEDKKRAIRNIDIDMLSKPEYKVSND